MEVSKATIILRDEAQMPCWRWISGPTRKDPIRRGNVSQWQVSRGRLMPTLRGCWTLKQRTYSTGKAT